MGQACSPWEAMGAGHRRLPSPYRPARSQSPSPTWALMIRPPQAAPLGSEDTPHGHSRSAIGCHIVLDFDGVMMDSETEVRATGHGRKEEQEGWRPDSQSLTLMG